MTCEMRHQTCTGNARAAGRLSLRGALGYLASSALQLHRYRYLRTRMLHDSLERLDARERGKG